MTLHALVAAPWAAMVAALRMLRVISLSLSPPLTIFPHYYCIHEHLQSRFLNERELG